MYIPKTFQPEGNMDKKTEDLMIEPKIIFSYDKVESMLAGCETFLIGKDNVIDLRYGTAENIVKEIEYSKNELQSFCEQLKMFESCLHFLCAGTYLSALINKIIKEDEEIVLHLSHLEKKLERIGSFFSKGNLIVYGNGHSNAGELMRGGQVRIKGNVDNCAGLRMYGGKLVIEGTAGDETAYKMSGGELRAKAIKEISPGFISGEIYIDGEKVRG